MELAVCSLLEEFFPGFRLSILMGTYIVISSDTLRYSFHHNEGSLKSMLAFNYYIEQWDLIQ